MQVGEFGWGEEGGGHVSFLLAVLVGRGKKVS